MQGQANHFFCFAHDWNPHDVQGYLDETERFSGLLDARE